MAKVTKEQAIAELERRKGLSGIGRDAMSSLESAPEAFGDLISSIPGGIEKIGRYASSNNPVETLGNLGAGGVEGAAQLLSSPQVLARYLGEKFPELGKRIQGVQSPTFSEGLKGFEEEHGLAPRSEDEESVRGLGNLIFGGKGLTKLPNAASRVGALTAQQAGAGGDPIHAAILGMTGEIAAKAPWNKVKNVPQVAVDAARAIPEKTMDVVKNFPEIAGTAASTGLDTMANLGSAARIPAVPSMMEALSDYIKYKSVKPETVAKRKLFKDIEAEDIPKINERMEAANRLGLGYLTPAEATLSPFEAAKQGTIGRTSSGSKLLFEKGKQRSGAEETAINSLLDTIYNETELDPKKQAAYEKTMENVVPDEFIEKYSSDPLVGHAMKELKTKPVYKKALGSVSKNSFEFWDMVKRVLGDMEETAKGGSGRKPYEASVIGGTRKMMVNEMDKIEPEYKVARNISERQFTRKKLEDVFDKKSMTGNNFYNYIKSNKKFNETMAKLNAFPEAQQKLKDMRLLFGDLIPNDMPIRSAAALKRTSMSEARNKVDAMKQILDEKYGKEHDVAAVNLMTDPNWANVLSEFLQKKGK